MGIIAVSDVHLGYMNASKTESFSDKKSFVSFLDGLAGRDDITDFVICGDLLDMWRRDMVGVTIENLDILSRFQKLASKMKVHYMAGNHDYHIRYLTRFLTPLVLQNVSIPERHRSPGWWQDLSLQTWI